MGIKGDVLDLTDLQKRGLLKKLPEKVEEAPKVNSQGYVELAGAQGSSSNSECSSSLAGAGTGNSEKSYFDSSANSSNVDSVEFQGLKNKIDDLEYKLDRLMEKIAILESVK